MSKAHEDALRPHLSALVDGELEPLEAIALQRAVRQRPDMVAECQELEQLKLQVHVAGTSEPVPAGIADRLRSAVAHEAAQARDEQRARRWQLPVAAFAMAAAAIFVTVTALSPGPGQTVAPVAVDLNDSVLNRLVDVHTGGNSPMSLHDLRVSGTLLTLEQLPGSFITSEGERSRLVQASYALCDESEGGSTLAVLRADRAQLRPEVASALETNGVYVDVIDGVELRLSTSGDKLFVLLSEIAPVRTSDPI